MSQACDEPFHGFAGRGEESRSLRMNVRPVLLHCMNRMSYIADEVLHLHDDEVKTENDDDTNTTNGSNCGSAIDAETPRGTETAYDN